MPWNTPLVSGQHASTLQTQIPEKILEGSEALRVVCFLEDCSNLTVTEHIDGMFGDVHEYDTMICSSYEIKQKEGESMEEYML